MSDATPSALFSEVDSNRFGIRIGRARIASDADVAPALAGCESESIRMLIVRCQTDDFASIHALEAAGARLMDTLVYYQRNLRKGELPAELRENAIRPIQDADLPALEILVGETFKDYLGHYHADPRLDRKKSDEGYVEWATRMCLDRDAS